MKRMYLLNTALFASVAMAAAGKGGETMTADKPKFDFQKFELPISARGPGARNGEPNELAQKLAGVPIDLSFIEDVTVPATITDATERANAFKEAAKKLTNKIGGAIRRHRAKAGNEAHNFALRTVDDDTMGHGVRVWRVADSTAEEIAQAKAKAAEKASKAVASVSPTPPPPPPPPAQ